MILDLLLKLEPDNCAAGMVAILDMQGVQLGHALQLTPKLIKRSVDSWTAYPCQPKLLEFTNTPRHVNIFLNTFRCVIDSWLISRDCEYLINSYLFIAVYLWRQRYDPVSLCNARERWWNVNSCRETWAGKVPAIRNWLPNGRSYSSRTLTSMWSKANTKAFSSDLGLSRRLELYNARDNRSAVCTHWPLLCCIRGLFILKTKLT